jgi:hypothetical protein
VDRFYSTPDPQAASAWSATPAPVDRRIHEKVWEWLTSHPDVWVGKEKEGNNLSFNEILARSPPALPETSNVICEQQLIVTVNQTSSTPLPSSISAAEQTHGALDNQSQHADTSKHPKPDKNSGNGIGRSCELLIYTTVGRMWQAVAGHAVDPKKIPDMEFKCLRIIAAAGPRGITQPDLVKTSQQDKRSVPKRTDNLHENKYISKTNVYVKRHKTSLLTHRRYLKSADNHTKDVFSGGKLIFDNLLDCLGEWLKDGNVMTLEELDERFGAPEKSWERDSLWRAYERLDIVGIIQRFHRTQENPDPVETPAGRMRQPKPYRIKCFRLLKNPTAEDRRRYHAITVQDRNAFRRKLEAQDTGLRAEHAANAEGDDYAPEHMESTPAESSPAHTAVARYTGLIKWSPDTLHTNLLYNIIAETGEAGMSTMVNLHTFHV